jgi:long-chain acyl-CoA synthetase
VVVGDGRPYVVALLVPNFERLQARLGALSPRQLIEHPETRKAIEKILRPLNASLPEHERVRRFHLLERELSIEDGELTPTLKIRRKVIAQRYAEPIAALYPKSSQ